ncbi:hypothetical protein HDE_13007 [Halotydeus destructor]|nr:hypothetical protein HDE_13007 [Halotydeus destructor]
MISKVLPLVVLIGLTSGQQFNNHEFLRHPGQEFRQDNRGLHFSQQVSHSPQGQGQSQQFAPQQQRFSPESQQPSMQQLANAIAQLSPQQLQALVRTHPSLSQGAPQPQRQQFSPQPPQPQQFSPQQPQQQQQFSPQQPQQQFNAQPDRRFNPAPAQSAQNNAPATVSFNNVGQAPGGDYKFGYHTGSAGSKDNSFREETRLPDGTVKGAYGYVDANGKQRIVKYTAGKEGFQVEGDIHPDQGPAGPATPAPAPLRQAASEPQPSFADASGSAFDSFLNRRF